MKVHRLILATTVLIAAAVPLDAIADEIIRFEAEDFVLKHNIGLENIQRLSGGSCSSGYLLSGLDYPAEWVEYDQVHIDTLGYYIPRARIMGEYQAYYEIQMIFTPCQGGSSESAIITATGKGYG
jgi:hypothetical protein